MRNFTGAIRESVLNLHAEKSCFYAAGAYFYAEQPYFLSCVSGMSGYGNPVVIVRFHVSTSS